MQKKIEQYFERVTPEIKLSIDLIIGITQSRQVSSTVLANYVSGEATIESKKRRIERLYSNEYVEPETLLEAIEKMFDAKKFKLTLDRTDWEFGEKSINAFVAFASSGKIGSLVGIKMLSNHGGNSKSCDRIGLAKEVIQKYTRERIELLLGDREFLSLEFAHWLLSNDIPFVLRARENLEFIQPYLRQAKRFGKIFKNVLVGKFNDEEVRCDLSIKKLADEYLIVVSHKVSKPLGEYKERWDIERFFKMVKTGGLNIESTKITDPSRLIVLFLLCSIAYLVSVKIGVYRHDKIKKIRWRYEYKCHEYSYFRWGLDWLRQLLYDNTISLIQLLNKVFAYV